MIDTPIVVSLGLSNIYNRGAVMVTPKVNCQHIFTHQVCYDLQNPGLDPLNALPGPLQHHFVRISPRAREADNNTTILFGDIVDELKIIQESSLNTLLLFEKQSINP